MTGRPPCRPAGGSVLGPAGDVLVLGLLARRPEERLADANKVLRAWTI